MKQLIHTTSLVILLFFAIFIQYSCHENVLINSKISPSNNAIGVYSVSLPCMTYTYYSDSAVTSTNIGGVPIYQGVGSFIDPFFGSMVGATYFQIVPQYPSTDTFTGYTMDSAFLIMPYSGFTWGDTTATTGINYTQTYQVFYMLDTMTLGNTYYSNSTEPIDLANPLSAPTAVNIYHLRDSAEIYPNVLDVNHPGLRIPLNLPVIKNRIYNAIQNISSTSTNPFQDFMNAFNGICLRVADTRKSSGAIPYFQLDGLTDFSQAGVAMYYHPTGTTVTADSYSIFNFNTSYCAHFNSINRSYRQYPVNQLIQAGKANTQIVALQNQPGASIDVVIPRITTLPAGVINKAELQLTLLPQYNVTSTSVTDTFFAPERLYPTGIANALYPPGAGAGVAYNIADRYPLYSTSPLAVLDGFLHTGFGKGGNLQTFTIDIPREVMYSLSQKNDTIHLQVNGSQDFYGAFHMVAGGGNYGNTGTSDTLYRAKLVVTYSQLTNH